MNTRYRSGFTLIELLVVIAIIDEYFKDLFLTLCAYTTGKQVELTSG